MAKANINRFEHEWAEYQSAPTASEALRRINQSRDHSKFKVMSNRGQFFVRGLVTGPITGIMGAATYGAEKLFDGSQVVETLLRTHDVQAAVLNPGGIAATISGVALGALTLIAGRNFGKDVVNFVKLGRLKKRLGPESVALKTTEVERRIAAGETVTDADVAEASRQKSGLRRPVNTIMGTPGVRRGEAAVRALFGSRNKGGVK